MKASDNESNWEEESKGNAVEQSMEVGIGEPHIVTPHTLFSTRGATQSPEVTVRDGGTVGERQVHVRCMSG